jgi:hypothetical protein
MSARMPNPATSESCVRASSSSHWSPAQPGSHMQQGAPELGLELAGPHTRWSVSHLPRPEQPPGQLVTRRQDGVSIASPRRPSVHSSRSAQYALRRRRLRAAGRRQRGTPRVRGEAAGSGSRRQRERARRARAALGPALDGTRRGASLRRAAARARTCPSSRRT